VLCYIIYLTKEVQTLNKGCVMLRWHQHCLHDTITRAPFDYHFSDVYVSYGNAIAYVMKDKNLIAVMCWSTHRAMNQFVNAALLRKSHHIRTLIHRCIIKELLLRTTTSLPFTERQSSNSAKNTFWELGTTVPLQRKKGTTQS